MTVKKFDHFSQWPADQWPWHNFSPAEMASKREGELHLCTATMGKLQALRTRLGRPLIITSAYRSEAHNRAVGGSTNSFHVRGMAFDVRMDNQNPVEFEREARAVGFTGFGHYVRSGFMHIDTRPQPLTFRGAVTDWPATPTGMPAEQPRPPERLRENTEAQAAGGIAAVSGAVTVANEASKDGGILERLQDPTMLIALVAIVAAWLAYRAWSKQ